MLLVEELFSLPDTHKDAIDSTNESPLNAKAIGGAKLVNVPIAPLKVDKIFNQSLPDISPSVTPIIVKGRLFLQLWIADACVIHRLQLLLEYRFHGGYVFKCNRAFLEESVLYLSVYNFINQR